MKKRNKQSLFEERLRNIVSKNIKRFINEKYDIDYTTITYDLFLNMDFTDEEFEELEHYLQNHYNGVFNIFIERTYERIEGDYYTEPQIYSEIKLINDDGFYKEINKIPNEKLKEKIIDDFETFYHERGEEAFY